MFIPTDWRKLEKTAFSLFAEDWTLITAGLAGTAAGPGGWNTMTASWGGFGQLWNRDVAFIFVRPSRYTFEFVEKNPGFSLSFFGEEKAEALKICGSISGRESDKAKAAGITPMVLGAGEKRWTSFEEARLVLACTKIYAQDLDPAAFLDSGIAGHYPEADYHRLYIGEIEAAWKRG